MSGVHEAPFRMAFPLFVLSICSIFIGYLTRDMMIGLGTDFWGNALFTLPQNAHLLEAEFIDTSVKLVPLVLSLSGAGLAFILYNFGSNLLYNLKISNLGIKLYTFFNRKWFFDKVYNEIITQNLATFAYKHSYQNLDRGIIELLGPNGISTNIYSKSSKINRIQTGFLFHYILTSLLFLFIGLIFIGYWDFLVSYIDPKVVLLVLLAFWFILSENTA
jgi:NADH-ubiquinone oxidoreductase chain 5